MVLNKFIVLEGIDGSGTSTQLKKLEKFFIEKKIKAFITCEPTDSLIGKLIRSILSGENKIPNSSLAYLFAADRDYHINHSKGILYHINKSEVVICDRYFFSTMAYQSLQSDMDSIYNQNKDFPIPQLTFFIDTQPSEADKRINSRNQNREIYEKIDLQKKIRKNYFKAFEYLKNSEMKLIILDGNNSIENLAEQIQTEIQKLL